MDLQQIRLVNKSASVTEDLLANLALVVEQQNGSDIIINARSRPAVKINGEVMYVGSEELTAEQTEEIVKNILTDKQWQQFEASNEMNLMTEASGIAHFRTNVFRQRGEIGLVLRLIPLEIPTLEKLQFPDLLKTLAVKKRGLVLFSGATGVGKSTSLAAMLDYRNTHLADHIITIEDPIEFIHRNKESMVTQREVGIDTDSYSVAMKSALRQAPDVVFIGEIRDREVMEQALAFVETGHAVFATIHATTTKLTLERIVNLFPHDRREQLMLDLSHNLQAIITQRLMMRADGQTRIAALEVMSNTPHIRSLIRDSRFEDLFEAMSRATLREGVITIDNYIFDLYEQGEVTYEEALLYVDSPNNFRIRLRTESRRTLPNELKSSDNSGFQLEKSNFDETPKGVYGNFSR